MHAGNVAISHSRNLNEPIKILANQVGEFVEAKCRVVRRTRSLVFMAADLVVGPRVVATANGVWKTLGKRS